MEGENYNQDHSLRGKNTRSRDLAGQQREEKKVLKAYGDREIMRDESAIL